MIDVSPILEDVPKYKGFLTIDELNERSEQLAKEQPEKSTILRSANQNWASLLKL